MAHLADALKVKGNALFKDGDYAGAEEQYTLGIQKYSKNPLLFTNRALVRSKLLKWEDSVDDCLRSIELSGQAQNYKAYVYLAQAQLALHHPHEALSSALTAYEQVMNPTAANATASAASTSMVSNLVLQCKKAKFAARERHRQQQRGEMLGELEDVLERNKRRDIDEIEAQRRDGTIGIVEADEQRLEILANTEKKTQELRSVFALADPANHQAKEIPDWAVDSITFELMHDPVMTKNGHSYERATLIEHLKRSSTDPLTRDPLTVKDLRPNIALKKALDEFWETSGNWAMDW